MSKQQPRVIRSLKSYLDNVVKIGRMESSGIHKIMSDIRGILESKNLNSAFPVLRLYCDWMNHEVLDRPRNLRVLEDISKAVNANLTDSSHLVRDVNRCLNLSQLREEMKTVLEQHGINSLIVSTDRNWKEILKTLISELLERKISAEGGIYETDGIASYEKVCRIFNNKYTYVIVSLSLVETISEDSEKIEAISWRVRLESPGMLTARDKGCYLEGDLIRIQN